MVKGFLLWLIVAYSSGENGGAALKIETRDFSSKAQCETAANFLEKSIKPELKRVIAVCTARDIGLEDLNK